MRARAGNSAAIPNQAAMNMLVLDTNIVSILFKPTHSLHRTCFEIVEGNQWFISFMTRGELLLWPSLNRWGATRCKSWRITSISALLFFRTTQPAAYGPGS